MVSPFLLAEAHQAIDRLVEEHQTSRVSATKVQLIASPFYESLRAELNEASDPSVRLRLIGALHQCRLAARGATDSAIMLAVLQTALATLETTPVPVAPARPTLRLIQGGLA